MRSPANRLGYNSSQGSLQNKLVGRGWGKPRPETRGSRKSNGNGSSHQPAFGEGWLGRMLSTVTPHQILLKCSKMEIKLVLSGMCQIAAIRQKEPILFSSATVTQVTHTRETCR